MRTTFIGVLACLAWAIAPSRAAPEKTEASASKTFENWTATCDNLRDCVVIGSSDDGDGLFYVRIERGAAMQAEPKIKLVLATSDPIPGTPGTFQLKVNTPAQVKTNTFSVAASKDDPDGAALSGSVRDTGFLSAIQTSNTLDFSVGTLKGQLALKGLGPALRFIAEHQGRMPTPGSEAGQVARKPSPPSPPVVEPASVAAAAVAAPKLSRALLDMAKPACDPEVVEAHSDAAAWTIGPNRQLVAVPCSEGPYNISVALFTTDSDGGQPRPAMLEQPPKHGDAEADNVVVNYLFEEKTLTLTSLDKGRGLGDCGASRTWVWTGEIFALLHAAELEACPGALPEDWPPIFQALRK